MTHKANVALTVLALLVTTGACKEDRETKKKDEWSTGTYTPPPKPLKKLPPLPKFSCKALPGGLATARAGAAAGLLQDGELLVSGGRKRSSWLDSAEIYDPQTGKSVPAGKMKHKRVLHQALPLGDGRVLIYGGGGKELEVYDGGKKRWRVAGRIKDDAVSVAATRLPDGRVYVAGGELTDRRELSRDAVIWDPERNRVKRLPQLKQGFKGRAFVDGDGKLVLLARLTATGVGKLMLTDPSKGTMEPHEARSDLAKAYKEIGRLAGGEKMRLARDASGALIEPPTALREQTILRFFPSRGAWRTLARLKHNHEGGDIVGVGKDRLIVIGANDSADAAPEVCTPAR